MASHFHCTSPPNANAWKCPICLEAKGKPKLLPCTHSFCQRCLETAVAMGRTDDTFSCPLCREAITIPSGGAAAFKVNFYIEVNKIPPNLLCENNHTKQRELELYCFDCSCFICYECKYTGHTNHNTEKIDCLADAKRADVTDKIAELDLELVRKERKEQHCLQERQNLSDKKQTVKGDILRRHQLMVDTADRYRDDALSTLDSVTDPIDSQLEKQVADLKIRKGLVKMHQESLEWCLAKKQGVDFIETTTRIIKDANNLEEESSLDITTMFRPVLSFLGSEGYLRKVQRQFLGHVVRMDMAMLPGSVRVSVIDVIRCGPIAASNEVFSLFPKINKSVVICYGSKIYRRPHDFRILTLSHDVSIESLSAISKANPKGKDTDAWLTVIIHGYFIAKSGKPFMLATNRQSRTCMLSLLSKGNLTVVTKRYFHFQCEHPRGFDVDEGGSIIILAVVEEATAGRRRVCLYRKPEPAPIAIYEPPSPETFQPTDVCFCKIQDWEVLLVADELGDCVHVLHVDELRLVFSHYLAAGHPLLIQPTALNVDMAGDVWLACRGGAVLRLQLTEDMSID